MKTRYYFIVFLVSLFVYACIYIRITERVTIGLTSSEASDLSDSDLKLFEKKAIQDGDFDSAARVYWYYRLTKKDRIETEKWDAITKRLDPTGKWETGTSNPR